MRIYWPNLVLVFIGLVATGCAGTIAIHDFEYYGTDALRTDQEFFYAKQGVVGKAVTEYQIRGGGFVRDGLVADAKSDLAEQHPLAANQAYTNMAIDVIREDIGHFWGGNHIAKKIRVSVVISADVIEFGVDNSIVKNDVKSSGVLPVTESGRKESTEGQNQAEINLSNSLDKQVKEEIEKRSDNTQSNLPYLSLDDFVWVEHKAEAVYGYVIGINPDQSQVKVEFTYLGVQKKRWFAVKNVFRSKEDVGKD